MTRSLNHRDFRRRHPSGATSRREQRRNGKTRSRTVGRRRFPGCVPGLSAASAGDGKRNRFAPSDRCSFRRLPLGSAAKAVTQSSRPADRPIGPNPTSGTGLTRPPSVPSRMGGSCRSPDAGRRRRNNPVTVGHPSVERLTQTFDRFGLTLANRPAGIVGDWPELSTSSLWLFCPIQPSRAGKPLAEGDLRLRPFPRLGCLKPDAPLLHRFTGQTPGLGQPARRGISGGAERLGERKNAVLLEQPAVSLDFGGAIE